MKLSTPQKKISIKYDEKLSENEYANLFTAITTGVSPDIHGPISKENDDTIFIGINDLQNADTIFNICKKFSLENNLSFTVLLYTETVVELDDDISTDEFLGKYIKMPESDACVSGLTLRFIYDYETDPLLVWMEKEEKNSINVKVFDILNSNYNFNDSYRHIMSAIHKIINF